MTFFEEKKSEFSDLSRVYHFLILNSIGTSSWNVEFSEILEQIENTGDFLFKKSTEFRLHKLPESFFFCKEHSSRHFIRPARLGNVFFEIRFGEKLA